MGRIIGYQYDDNVQDGDAWIGSEDGGGRTKQYTAEAVANYLNIQGKISIVGQMTYKYGITPLSGPGTFAVFGGGTDPVAFSAITKLTLSNTDVSKQRVVEFLNLLVGSDILISKQSAISTFGYYSIDNYAVNATDPAYYDLGVTFKSGNGSMEAEQIYETQNFTLAAEENISTLQTTIDSGNTYQASTPDVLWTWNSAALVVDGSDAPDGYEGIFSGKYLRLRSTDFPNYTTLSNGSLVMPLPGAVNTKFRLSANPLIVAGEEIGILSPATSGTLALTTDITASPWDTVTGGINYANGNVGIGTPNPGYALTIKSSGNASQDFILIQNSSNNSMFTVASDPSGNANLAVRNSAGIAKISINTAGDSFFGGGNVGIGTTSPLSPLHVASFASGPIARFINTSGTGGNGVTIQGGNGSGIILSLSDYSNIERLRVNGDGNVGIGTTAPGYNLHIADTDATINLAKTDGDQYLRLVGGSGTNSDVIAQRTLTLQALSGNVLLQPTGNVGIGTTSPNAKLQVNDNVRIGNTSTGVRFYIQGVDEFRADALDVAGNGWNSLHLRADGTDGLFLQKDTNNVGIGTTSPSTELDVVGTARMDTGITEGIHYVGTGLEHWGDGGTGMSFPANDILSLRTASSDRLYINATGNVGIRTTSPAHALDVAGYIRSGNTGANNTSKYSKFLGRHYTNSEQDIVAISTESTLSSNNVYIGGGFSPNNSATTIKLYTANNTTTTTGSERMRINSLGNVGIGTISPTNKLSVAGGNIEIHNGGATWLGSDATGGFARTFNGNSFRFISSANSETMRINNATGNVGIGTTSPIAKLTINSTSGDNAGGLSLYDGSGTAFYMYQFADNKFVLEAGNGLKNLVLDNAGNVGIGTASPTQLLDVAGADAEIVINDSNDAPALRFRGSGVTSAMVEVNSAKDMFFKTGGVAEQMRITSAGNVGIGTTSPSEKLEVSGRIKVQTSAGSLTFKELGVSSATIAGSATVGIEAASNFRVKTNITNEAFTVLSTGKVGIGTTSPSQKLEVDGQVLSDGYRLAAMQTAPATRNSTGTLGEIVIDGNHIYVCYATDSWSRVALDTSW